MLDNLNNKQIEAVTTINGPVLVLAGPGSGKTKTLTSRIEYLINECNIKSYNILALTFTNKAAREMKERLLSSIGDNNAIITTFHSLGLRIIKENYSILDYSNNLTVMDRSEQITLLNDIIKNYNLINSGYSASEYLNFITNYKNSNITPEESKKFKDKYNNDNVYLVYSKYEKTLKNNNVLDFDDLLLKPLLLFKKNKDILEKYQDKFKYILVDEYQDTNLVQYELVKYLSSKYYNLFVVGDDAQSIYSWRGADIKNILSFKNDFKDCKVIHLEQNYRSTKNILNCANECIKHNKNKIEKTIWTENEKGNIVAYQQLANQDEEVIYIINKINELIKQGGKYSEIAILYRVNALSRTIEEKLIKSNIPYMTKGGINFYERKEIKDLLSYLKLIYNFKDDLSLIRIINEPSRKIGEKTIEKIKNDAIMNHCSMFDAITSGKELNFKNLILELNYEINKTSLDKFVELVINKTGLLLSNSTDSNRANNLLEFISFVKEHQNREDINDLGDLINSLSLVTDTKDDEEVDRVSLMTLHGSKGLEYNYVFIYGVEENILPSSRDDTNIEEERRLFYVGITRAKKQLWITSSLKRMLYGRTELKNISEFINELNENVILKNNCYEKDNKFTKSHQTFEREIYETTEFNYGDKVYHDKYGEGTVVQIDKKIIRVAFIDRIELFIKGHSVIKKVRDINE